MNTDFFFTGLVEPFHFDSSLLPTWKSSPSAADQFTYPSEQSPDFFLTSIFNKSMEPYTSFESPLISTVSSPNSATSADPFAIQDHAGNLSTVRNSVELLTAAIPYLGDNANNSCYISMFNSSPNLQLPIMNHYLINTPPPVNPLPSLSLVDPRFADRTAEFQNNQFGIQNHIELPHTSGTLTSSNEEPEQNSLGEGEFRVPIDLKSKKRQARPKGKKPIDNACKLEDENGEPNAKRSRLIKAEIDANEPCETPKDYIHVRARRGQATDSHSLAERVRREKISERMKLLEDLVPGCSKVTGKALMLDEIINYVQSLQRQVEFLSMKLATVNHSRLDFNLDSSFFKKDMFQPSGVYPLGTSHAFDCTEIDGQLNCGSVDPMASCLNIVDEFGQVGSRVIDNLSYDQTL